MYEKRFSNWLSWSERRNIPERNCPGVYIAAFSERNLAGKPFTWRKEIIYIGMTNSVGGLMGVWRSLMTPFPVKNCVMAVQTALDLSTGNTIFSLRGCMFPSHHLIATLNQSCPMIFGRWEKYWNLNFYALRNMRRNLANCLNLMI